MSSVIPILAYRDQRAAIDFLRSAFGFEPLTVVENGDGGIQHAELRLGDGIVMLAPAGDAEGARPAFDAGAHRLYVAVDDTDTHHARAKAAGADIVEAPTDRDYGSREYAARDSEGGVWWFGTYVPETSSAAGG